jgi:hypothetical protein
MPCFELRFFSADALSDRVNPLILIPREDMHYLGGVVI